MLTLDLLRVHSQKIGINSRLVQANGGNTSLKIDGVAYVKASGKYLRNATTEDIFCRFSLSDLSKLDILTIEDFAMYALDQELNSKSMKPSLETNFHLMLNRNVVTHVHSLGAVALSVINSDIYQNILETNFSISIIPYAKPGSDLAKTISQYSNLDSDIYLLQNHGAIFCGENFANVEILIDEFENFAIKLLNSLPTKFDDLNSLEILSGGVLTPDEAVYLGSKPWLEILGGRQNDLDMLELVNFYSQVADLIQFKSNINYLTEDQVDAIISWDREKMRREQTR